MKLKALSVLIIVLLVTGCKNSFEEVPEEKLIGTWELKGRGMFDGIQIKVQKENNKITGRIVKLNDNKMVKMFADVNDVWVSEIRRTSNFEFRLIEKKIARELFSLYGLPTSQEFKVEFLDDNTLGLGADNSDPQHTTITYKRVQ
jgi:hypothetical protein